jgi:hypothetical protein
LLNASGKLTSGNNITIFFMLKKLKPTTAGTKTLSSKEGVGYARAKAQHERHQIKEGKEKTS